MIPETEAIRRLGIARVYPAKTPLALHAILAYGVSESSNDGREKQDRCCYAREVQDPEHDAHTPH